MSNETPEASAAPAAPTAAPITPSAPVTPAAPADPAAPPAATTPPITPPAAAEPTPYKIPDAYKEKPWASKIKSEEDLYKQIDNLTGLVGKKSVAPDFKTATPEAIEEYFAGLRPADKKAYQFGEGVDEAYVGSVADILYENGISEFQANKLIPAYQALEQKQLEAATSADGFKAVMTEGFGEKYDAVVAHAEGHFKTALSESSQQLLDVMPNQFLRPLYEMAEAHRKAIADLKKQYGVEENGDAHIEKGGTVQPQDITKVRADLRRQISEIDARPHTAAERQKLVDDLHNTYANQPQGKK